MTYNEITRRYFERAPRAGILHGSGFHRGTAGSVAQGAWVQFDLRSDSRLVREVKFLCFGCPHTIAVSAWVAENAPGGALSGALPRSVKALQALFEAPAEKLGRLLTVEDAWRAASRAALET